MSEVRVNRKVKTCYAIFIILSATRMRVHANVRANNPSWLILDSRVLCGLQETQTHGTVLYN